MRIKKIVLTEYKRFRKLTIDLGNKPKRIIALVGENGCGKSSVFDGMLYHFEIWNKIGCGEDRGPYYHLNNGFQGKKYHTQIFLDNGKTLEKTYMVGNASSIIPTRFSFRSSYRYNTLLKVYEIKSMTDISYNMIGANSTSSLDERAEYNYRKLWALFNDLFRKENMTYNETIERIIGELNQSINQKLSIIRNFKFRQY